MSIKALIHDWDDTITSSFESYSQFYFDLGEHFGLEGCSIDEIKKHWGGSMEDIAQGVYPYLLRKEAEEKTLAYLEHMKISQKRYTVGIFPQIKETFEHLFNKGILLGVISSGHREEIERIYKEQISPSTEKHLFIFDHHDCGFRKPDPKVFNRAFELLEPLGISEDETIYVGDSIQDYQAARDRGITFYAVTTGLRTREDFLRAGLEDEFILGSFREIIEIVG